MIVRSLFLTALLALVCGSPAAAQIVQIELTDAKALKRYKRSLSDVNGMQVLLGEPVEGGGIRIEPKNGQVNIHYQGGGQNELFLLDIEDPTQVPYEVEGGKKVPLKRNSVLSVAGKDIARLSFFQPNETIESLAGEYSLRLRRVEDMRAARDGETKGSSAWLIAHRRMLGGYERLISWLRHCSFVGEAGRQEKTYDKESRKVADEAITLRAKVAQESVKRLGATPDLVEALKAVGDGKHELRMQESQHVRMIYETAHSDERISSLLRHAERVIEVFRNQFVDPYVSDEFPNHIPEGLFQEFYLGPYDVAFHEAFVVAYYGNLWGGDEAQKQRLLQSTGSRFVHGEICLDLWRVPEREDLEGVVTHTLGHSLADYHFNTGPRRMEQPWMEEGLGYYLSFELLGRNSVVCAEFDPGTYVRQARGEGKKEVGVSYREALTKSALEYGPRIDRLLIKDLYAMDSPDLAKSWSFLEYVARTHDLSGQLWLRASCNYAKDKSTLLTELRSFSERLYAAQPEHGFRPGTDFFDHLDQRWRAHTTETTAGGR